MKILFLGASNTDCGHCFTPDNLGNGYVKYTAGLLRDSYPGTFDDSSFINGGTDGFTFPRIFRKWDAMYRCCPIDFAVICGGINEVGIIMNTGLSRSQARVLLSDSADSLEKLLSDLLKQENMKHVFLCEPFLFDTPACLQNWIPYLTWMRTIIKFAVSHIPANRVTYIATQEMFDDLCRKYSTASVSPDGIHLSEAGHRALAELLFGQICDMMGTISRSQVPDLSDCGADTF